MRQITTRNFIASSFFKDAVNKGIRKVMYKKWLITLCIVWLLPFIITSFYNHPAIDDYWSANAVMAYGKIGAVQYFYHNVSARYFSLWVMSLCNTLPGGEIWIFKVWPVLIIMLLFTAFYFFYGSFTHENRSQSQVLLLTCLFVVLHIANMRTLFEGLYWMSSTVCYQLGLCVFAIGMGAVVRDIRNPRWSTKMVAILCAFILPGTVEILIPVYVLTLILLLWFSYKFHYSKTVIISSLSITLLLSLLVVLSKGNLSRVESNHSFYNPSLSTAVWYTLKSVTYYSVIWLVSPLFLSVFLLIVLSMPLPDKMVLNLTKKDRVIVAGYFILSALSVYLPLHLFESSLPFPRITTLFFFVFFHACLVIILFTYPYICKTTEKLRAKAGTKHIRSVVTVVLIVCAFTNKNFVLTTKDLLEGTTAKYDMESYQRYRLIRNCNTDTCFVPAYKHHPYFTLSSQSETLDSNYFQHMDVYFKKTILFK